MDYIVNLTYGSMDALKTIRDFTEKHGCQAIGNIGCDATVSGFEDFVKIKENELQFLREGKVRVVNYDVTVAYGADRDDGLLTAVQTGAFDELPPVHVEVAARLLIDRLIKDWIA